MNAITRLAVGALFAGLAFGMLCGSAAAQDSGTVSAAVQAEDPSTEATEYIVQRGDTLAEIAASFGVSLEVIIGANPQIGNIDSISVGQVIVIPGNLIEGDVPDVAIPVPEQSAPEGFAELIITTEPGLEGFPISVDGKQYETNDVGQLRVVLEVGEHHLSVPEIHRFDADTRVIFARWSDEWAPSRTIELRRTTQLALGLYVQHFVTFEFVDGLGMPVDLAEIDSATLMNSNGESFTFSNEGDEDGSLDDGSLNGVWLTRNRLRRTGGVGLLQKDNIYTMRNVYFNGVDAVQQGRDEYIPSPGARWEIPLLLFPLEVEVRNFGFNRLADVSVALHLPEGSTVGTTVEDTVDGVARFAQVPPGDFELEVVAGGFSPVTPIVFGGPKTEHLTVVTAGLAVVGIFLALLAAAAIMMFVIRPVWRIRIMVATGLLLAFLLSVPSIGAVITRPLSAEIEPIYDTNGVFVGIEAIVRNDGPVMIAQIYCQPDFELRIIGEDQIWSATYESHDFHDVEMGECREHRVASGVSHHVISPQPGQEWSVIPNIPLPPGQYQAYVRIFDIPAPAITIDLTEGLSEDIQYVEYDPLRGEVPFTNSFED